MATRASVYSALLKRFRSKEDDFLSRLVTVDETWVHYYEPENKARSHQSVGPGSPRPSVYSALLKRFRSKEDDFLSRLVTVDETWVHFYETENKARSHQSVGPGSPRPKKFKMQPCAGKVMAAVFWHAKGVIILDFLAKESTITGVYYANLLD